MKPFVILEGPDCSGKTTLSRHFGERGFVRFHLTYTPSLMSGMLDYQLHVLRDVAENLERFPVVLDRAWISEWVYGQILRPDSAWRENMTEVRRVCERLNPRYIMCDRADIEEFHAAHQDKGHPYPKRKFAKIVRGYREALADMKQDFFMSTVTWPYDPTTDGRDMQTFATKFVP